MNPASARVGPPHAGVGRWPSASQVFTDAAVRASGAAAGLYPEMAGSGALCGRLSIVGRGVPGVGAGAAVRGSGKGARKRRGLLISAGRRRAAARRAPEL